MTPVAIVSHSCEGARRQLGRFSHWRNNDAEQMEIKLWRRIMGHKHVEQKAPKTEPRMDVPDAYVVDQVFSPLDTKGNANST